jgi:double-stranded uracil-DNA glycosylase
MSESEPTWVPWPPPRARCAEGAGRSIPDLIADDLRVLLVGINPSLCSGATGYHFATPGNRFWPTMHRAGWTDRQVRPDEPAALLALGIGITNLVNRATASADEVTRDELRAGAEALRSKVGLYRPRAVAVLGISAYRPAFDEADARVGRQPRRLGGAPIWVLPNPSGLNAHYGPAKLVEHFTALREAVA